MKAKTKTETNKNQLRKVSLTPEEKKQLIGGTVSSSTIESDTFTADKGGTFCSDKTGTYC